MLNFYIIAFYIKYFPGSMFVNSIALGSSDIVSYAIAAFLLKKSNTRVCLVVSFILSVIGSVTYQFVKAENLIPVVVILCRSGNAMAITTLYSTNNRFYPSYLLTSSFGILNLTAHVVAIAGPIVAEMAEPYPIIIFGISAAVSCLGSIFLKEIRHTETNLPNGPM